jgi:hypothetical protein
MRNCRTEFSRSGRLAVEIKFKRNRIPIVKHPVSNPNRLFNLGRPRRRISARGVAGIVKIESWKMERAAVDRTSDLVSRGDSRYNRYFMNGIRPAGSNVNNPGTGAAMASRRRGKGRRKVGQKKRRMRSRIRHRKR